jgi:hypothetical protein
MGGQRGVHALCGCVRGQAATAVELRVDDGAAAVPGVSAVLSRTVCGGGLHGGDGYGLSTLRQCVGMHHWGRVFD